MQASIEIPVIAEIISSENVSEETTAISNNKLSSLHSFLIWVIIKTQIFFITCFTLRNPWKILKAYRATMKNREIVWGGKVSKLYKVDGKYYYTQYTPGWPSQGYFKLVKSELRRMAEPDTSERKLSFVFLAITRKCPLRCEHCFEWDNLNKKESFTSTDLMRVVKLYEEQGVIQFHFSGGEPMVRINDLEKLVDFASKKTICWVLSSGFNFTPENAQRLKAAGLTGVVISIDHYIPELHNLFRGNKNAFDDAVRAIRNAQLAGLVCSVSVCATKAFIEGGHLEHYMDFAKDLGVQFVQVLEPRMIGHYEGKPVMLEETHLQVLEQSFRKYNHEKEFSAYPTMLYHGYHQRRIGCFAGSRSVYIDSAGDVHACPFCHTSSYNIIELLRNDITAIPAKENKCPQFNKIA